MPKITITALGSDGRAVKVEIHKGSVTVDYQGFRGKECVRADEELARLLKALGVDYRPEAARRTAKPEMYMEAEGLVA